MHAMWVSLIENVKCRSKLANVIGLRERCDRRSKNSRKANLDGELVLAHGKETPEVSLTRSEVSNSEMHAMWVSLKENVKCGSKLADVIGLREKCDRRSKNSRKVSLDGELVLAHGKETPEVSLTRSEVSNREMHAMWVSLKENVKCGSKLADVIGLREKCDRRSKNSRKASLDGELVFAHGKETPEVSLTRSEVSNREMHAMWVSLKENVKCGSKLADVIGLREKCDRISKNSRKASLDGELVFAHGKETPFREPICRSSYTQAQLFELNIGDVSRNIIEMIVRKASMNPSKPSGRIKSVLRVNNSIETLERFEKYREKVKKMAKERYMRHPRSTVDGNELMRFYGTTMTCCNGESRREPELCNGPTCRVCRLIKSNFDTEYVLENGIQLSTSSENTIAVARAAKAKRAVIVCRTIAGSIINVEDKEYDESDSIGNRNLHSTTTEYLFVQNPSAVLPCFVVVFS